MWKVVLWSPMKGRFRYAVIACNNCEFSTACYKDVKIICSFFHHWCTVVFSRILVLLKLWIIWLISPRLGSLYLLFLWFGKLWQEFKWLFPFLHILATLIQLIFTNIRWLVYIFYQLCCLILHLFKWRTVLTSSFIVLWCSY